MPLFCVMLTKAKAASLNQVTFKRNVLLQVFKPEEEKLLEKYMVDASLCHFALTNFRARTLAYEFAQFNNINIPESWKNKKAAGKDWLRAFMNRHKLSFRTPEGISMSRATSFNEANVKIFFDNLAALKEKYKFAAQDIYNLDETGCITVHRPPKVIALKGQRTVSQMTSGERGTLITLVAIICASGKAVPPFLVFPRVNYKDHMIRNAPPGTKGVTNRSGWMISDLFLPVLEHFVLHERPTKEHPKLMILDNHESHLSIAAIEYAREHGIILLTLPPHCSHKLQPLGVAVFKSFKSAYNDAADRWLLNHPGSVITIYDVAQLVGEAFPKSFVPVNIISGFKKTGIEPYNSKVFGPDDYKSSYVTDRPDPAVEQAAHGVSLKSLLPPKEPKKLKKSSKKRLFAAAVSGNSDDSEDSEVVSLHDSDSSTDEIECEESPTDLEVGGFALVKVYSKSKSKDDFRYYICQVDEAYVEGYDVTFFKRVTGMFKFQSTEETGFVKEVDCVVNLPDPIKFKAGRFKGMVAFTFDFDDFSPIF